VRAFIAIEIPAEVRRGAMDAAERLAQIAAGFRVPAEANFHLTLAFLGEIADAKIFPLTTELGRALYGWEPFVMSLRGAGRFPPRGRPRVVWIGVADGKDSCERLARDVGRACALAGVAVDDKPFRPHLTLARARDRAFRGKRSGEGRFADGKLDRSAGGADPSNVEAWIRDQGEKPVGAPFRVERIVLFESTLTPKGSIYSERAILRLGKGGPHAR
jgi:2'-5' RNA ligase